jgi:hypothetical protein
MPAFNPAPTPTPEAPASARRLASLGMIGLIVSGICFWFLSPWESPQLKLLAIGICGCGIWPVLRWLQRNDQAYPILEVLQLTLIPFYAVPLLTEHEAVAQYRETVLIEAAFLVLVFQLSGLIGGLVAERTYRPNRIRPWWSDELASDANLRFTTYTLMANTGWLLVSSFTKWTPTEFIGTFRAVFFGIATISTFIQARLWGSGQLTRTQKAVFATNIFVQIALSSLGLLLVTGLILFLLTIVGYFSTARRVPWLLCCVAVLIFAVLHNGKRQMRLIYWGPYAPEIHLTSLPQYYAEWVQYGLTASSSEDIDPDERSAASYALFRRASLFQIVCYIVDTVPDRVDYLDGATYSLVLPQIIPRFLWPDKPSPNDSVKILSVRLGMLSAEQANITSIGYGLIGESYANFGVYGTLIFGLSLGWALRRIALSTASCNTISLGGVFRILCVAWCLNTETTLAVWLSSLYQACIALFLPLLAWRSFSGR